jgi:hypothetical protein
LNSHRKFNHVTAGLSLLNTFLDEDLFFLTLEQAFMPAVKWFQTAGFSP